MWQSHASDLATTDRATSVSLSITEGNRRGSGARRRAGGGATGSSSTTSIITDFDGSLRLCDSCKLRRGLQKQQGPQQHLLLLDTAATAVSEAAAAAATTAERPGKIPKVASDRGETALLASLIENGGGGGGGTLTTSNKISTTRKRRRSSTASASGGRKRQRTNEAEDEDDVHAVIVICGDCGKEFRDALPKRHEKTCAGVTRPTKPTNTETFQCLWCPNRKPDAYKSHLRRHLTSCRNRKSADVSIDDALEQCGFSKRRRQTPKNGLTVTAMEAVILDKRSGNDDDGSAAAAAAVAMAQVMLPEMFCCSFEDCCMKFGSRELMEAHHRRVGVFHRCETCQYQCEWLSSLLHHIHVAHPALYAPRVNDDDDDDTASDTAKLEGTRAPPPPLIFVFDPFDGEGFCSGVT